MPGRQSVQVDLAEYAPIGDWVPMVGDVIIWHGWINHWFGIVSAAPPSGTLYVITSGLPIALFTMNPSKVEKATKKIDAHDIKSSRHGEWAILQTGKGKTVWYV